MQKISLNLDTLLVESFETTTGMEQPRGTVRGAESAEPTEATHCGSCEASCGPTFCLFTCGQSCEVTCGDSCHGSCMGETCDFLCVGILTD
jgi:hypothetical protein